MTENWQPDPSPWQSPGPDRYEPERPERDRRAPEPPPDPTAPQGLTPTRLTLSGDSVQIGPPMVDPPRLRPATPPTPLTPPSPPPYIQQSSYGQLSYTQSPYTDEPYSEAPYVVKPLDNHPYGEPQYNSQLTPVPHSSYQQRPQPQPRPEPPPPAGAPIIGNDDGTSTMMVTVGTVQPRAPQPPASIEDAERVLGAAVDSLDADPDLYSIGTVTDGAVCLVPDDGRWAVFLADGGQRRFAGSFDDPMLAAVHFAGVLLIAATERGVLPRQAAAAQAALPGQNHQNGQNSQNGQSHQNGHSGYGGEPGRSTDPLAEFLAGPPITPLAQDPPTTLYTDHRLTVLTPGTEVDRFGDQLGNTVYVARTRYPHRSLPPDYIEREYRVYRVRDPLRALTGTAIPWFGQPGGGTAYLLPRPIRDLLREGALVEIPSATVGPV